MAWIGVLKLATPENILTVILQEDIVQTRWCRLVPIKLNMILWRVLRDRIPTKENLASVFILCYVLWAPHRVKIVVMCL